MLKQLFLGVTACLLVLTSFRPAAANPVYSETFDAGSATFTTNNPYWLDQTNGANGYIVQSTTDVAAFPFGPAIPNDAGGSGFFLFEGTGSYPLPNGPNIPAGQDQFFISPTFAVTPNTDYTVSFYTTDANSINNPSLQPQIDGSLLGSPVSPDGDFGSTGWQQFTFSWNSGANSSASLILHDYTQTATGNDFGIDNILVASASAAVPLPTTLTTGMVLLAGFGVAHSLRRRQMA